MLRMNQNLKQQDWFVIKAVNEGIIITSDISEAGIRTSSTIDIHGEPVLRVIKHGRTTQWSAGVSNEIRSECQREVGMLTREWCIVDLSGGFSFSERRDSGSIITDYRGRIVGILHGGGRSMGSGMDTTYATPIGCLLEDIRATLHATKVHYNPF